MMISYKNLLLEWLIFRFHVKLPVLFPHVSGFKQVLGGRVNHMNAKEVEKCHARPKVQMTPRATLASHISYRSPRREDYLITEGTMLQKFTCKSAKKTTNLPGNEKYVPSQEPFP